MTRVSAEELQAVNVRLASGRTYTYAWDGEEPLEVGDLVVVPPSERFPTPGIGEVVASEENFPGSLVVISEIHRRRGHVPRVLDMDGVARRLEARGVPAVVEMTGGGYATLYAGVPWDEPGWGDRYPAVAGPGQFHFGGVIPVADLGEFFVGPDDDDHDPDVVMLVHPNSTPDEVVDLIIEVVRRYTKEEV